MRFTDPRFTTLRFIFIAVVFMLLADHFIFGGKRSYIDEARQNYYAEQAQKEMDEAVAPPPVRVEPQDGAAYFEAEPPPMEAPDLAAIPDTPEPEDMTPPPVEAPEAPHEPVAIAALPPVIEPGPFKGTAKIAIVIDDLGMDVKRSRKVLDLPAPITLAFLPYGTKTREFAEIGRQKGHHLIIHTPMQAVDTHQNIGPMGLKANMTPAAFTSNFDAMLNSFQGYEGINNHMGSLLTQDADAMARLMVLLKSHDLYFLDSRTIGNSVAAKKAREAGVPYASRDVFLDHVDTRAFVDGALVKAERIALRRGSAIAIGHPKDATIAGLKAWIPTLKAKGIELVPVSDLLVRAKGSPSPQPSLHLGEGEGAAARSSSETKPIAQEEKDGAVSTYGLLGKDPLDLSLPEQLPAIY